MKVVGKASYSTSLMSQKTEFDQLLKLTSLMMKSDFVALKVKGPDGFWIKAKIGFEYDRISFKDSYWDLNNSALNELQIIPDARLHPQMRDHFLVTGPPNIVFFCGMPVISKEGELLGVITVCDQQHRKISEDQFEALKIIAEQMLKLIEAEREYKKLQQTELKLDKVTESLVQSELHYKSILDEAGDIIYELESNDKIIYVNESFEKITGYKKEELNTFKIYSLIPDDYRNEVIKFYQEQADGKSTGLSYKEFPIITKSGAKVWLGQKVRVKFGMNGGVNLIAVARDISEQIASNRKLIKYKNGLKLINYIASAPDYSLNEQINLALDIGSKYLGFESGVIRKLSENDTDSAEEEEILFDSKKSNLSSVDVIRQMNSHFQEIRFENAVETGSSKTSEQVDIPRISAPYYVGNKKSGVINFIADHNKDHSFDEYDREFVMLLAKWIGLTLEKQKMIKLSSEQEILKTFANFSPAAIAILDNELKYLAMTEKWRKVKGLEGQEVIGKNHLEIQVDIKDDWKKLYARILQGENFSSDHDIYIDKDGNTRHQRWEARPWYDNDNKIGGILLFVDDITELKNNEIELKTAKTIAENASKSKNQFLATMSHEIRTPLNAVIGISHLLIDESPRTDQLKSLQLLKSSGEHLLSLVNDILDFNKIEEGKLVLEKIEFNLKKLVHEIHHNFEFQSKTKSLDFSLHCDERISDCLIGDKTRIRQILVNLLSNALKFTHEGGLALRVTMKSTSLHHEDIFFEVEDTGIGISKEKIDNIFSPYIQAEMHTSRKYGGSGLGLTITERLLRKMKSEIFVSSEIGKGTTFNFTIRFKKGQEIMPDEQLELLAENHVTTDDHAGNILLVEDNVVNKLLAEKFLSKWGYQVAWAENGLECLKLIEDKSFDLILMDLQMPEMNGYETTIKIREKEPLYFQEIPIIALTADAFLETQSKIKAVGMNDLIIKPFNPEIFRRKLEGYKSLRK